MRPRPSWVAGLGAEWAVAKNWTLKTDYMHVGFGGVSTTATAGIPAANNPLTTKSNLNADIVRVGVNYKF